MGELKIKDKQIVVPGEVLAEGMDYLPSAGTYRNENDILSNQIGLASVSGRVIKVIPLTGKYKPKRNDIVIGEVVNILMSGWIVDIGGPYSAMLTLKDASSYNIQFKDGKPIFIDTLSFKIQQDYTPWIAYKQFCQHFLAPLVLMAKVDVRLNQLLKDYTDGIPLDLTSKLLPKYTYFSFPSSKR